MPLTQARWRNRTHPFAADERFLCRLDIVLFTFILLMRAHVCAIDIHITLVWACFQLSHDGAARLQTGRQGRLERADADDANNDDDDNDEDVSRHSNCTTPSLASKRDGVRLAVTSPPPPFATPLLATASSPASSTVTGGAASALSPPMASVISPFGSPSGWITSSGRLTDAATSPVLDHASVHINGDHVTQVRVDASVLVPSADSTPTTPVSTASSLSRRSQRSRATDMAETAADKDEPGSREEDRDQSELLVTARLAVSSSSAKANERDQQQQHHAQQQHAYQHVTAVQVEHPAIRDNDDDDDSGDVAGRNDVIPPPT